MNQKRSRLIAIITGAISILICVIYLLVIAFFDSRSLMNEYLINHSVNMEVISFLGNLFLYS